MSSEYNDLLSADLSEVTVPVSKLLDEQGVSGARASGALLCLVACQMNLVPTEDDHVLARKIIDELTPGATVSLLAQLAKAFAMAHYGFYKGAKP